MDNNQGWFQAFSIRATEALATVAFGVILVRIFKRQMRPLEEAVVVGILAFFLFGIGTFLVAPGASYGVDRLMIVLGVLGSSTVSLLTHPRRA
jgi:hypothetical protein